MRISKERCADQTRKERFDIGFTLLAAQGFLQFVSILDCMKFMPTTPLNLLLVEDNEALAQNVIDYFERQGSVVDFAADGKHGLAMAIAEKYDVVILDVALPKMDGLAVCRALRAQSTRHVAVLMLTARDTLSDKLAGFAGGADDYLTKPFALAELEARCLALSARHRVGADVIIRLGELEIDRRSMTVQRSSQDLRLTRIGFQILLMLAEAFPGPVSRSEISQKLWGDDPPDSDALRSHMHMLRLAVDRPFDHPMVRTVHGVGFQLIDVPK
jgi:DNA-binding response OmpR family regulator